MNQKLAWKGFAYNSTETCRIDYSEHAIVIQSIIRGKHKTAGIHCEYELKTSCNWEVTTFEVVSVFNGINRKFTGSKDNSGWIINNRLHQELRNCLDIDIALTPLTNSLPINRLTLAKNKAHITEVVYIDILEGTIRTAFQQYTKKSECVYNFQNVLNDFEATILVDKEGFVVHYPQLFERIDG